MYKYTNSVPKLNDDGKFATRLLYKLGWSKVSNSGSAEVWRSKYGRCGDRIFAVAAMIGELREKYTESKEPTACLNIMFRVM